MSETPTMLGRKPKPGPEIVRVNLTIPIGKVERLKERLTTAYRARGMTIDVAAEQAGISGKALAHRLESEMVTLADLMTLAEIAEIDVADLLVVDDEKLGQLARVFKAICFFASTDSAEMLEHGMDVDEA